MELHDWKLSGHVMLSRSHFNWANIQNSFRNISDSCKLDMGTHLIKQQYERF